MNDDCLIFAYDVSFSALRRGDLVSIDNYFKREYAHSPLLFIQAWWTGAMIPNAAADNLKCAADFGMEIAIYAVPYRRIGERRQALGKEQMRGLLEEARLKLGDLWERIRFIAVDVERVLDGPSGPSIADTIGSAISMIEVVREMDRMPVLYTGRWFWKGRMRDPRPAEIEGIAAWLAQYDYVPSLRRLRVDFGPGWRVVGKQFAGNITPPRSRATIDLNVFDGEWAAEWAADMMGGRG